MIVKELILIQLGVLFALLPSAIITCAKNGGGGRSVRAPKPPLPPKKQSR